VIRPRQVDGLRTDRSKIGGYLVAEHLLQAEAKQMWRIPAIRSGHNVSADACRAARPPVTTGATIGKTRSDGERVVDVARSVVKVRALTVGTGELALKELAPTSNGAKRIASDDERGRIGCHPISASCADLFYERLADSFISYVRSFSLVY
jgi:hypothetical protein